jgi:asparagine synthase (glutamine-hydrolysing)
VGSSLSGGLDSSTIVNIIAGYKPNWQKTFSASFPGYEKDETSYIKLVVDKVNAEAHYTEPTSLDLINNIDQLFYHQEEPFASSSILAQWEVMKLAKQQSTIVLLDGQGADEILGGYTYYYRSYFQELYSKNKKLFAKQYAAYKNWGGNHFKTDTRFKIQATFPSLYNYYLNWRSGPVRHPDIHDQYHSSYSKHTFKPILHQPLLNDYLATTIKVNGMLEALLRYADRNSMAFSREVRLPFLSHKLVEFLFSLPATYKINNGWSKYLLRKAYEGELPEKITWRKDKIGYASPESEWLKNKEVNQLINHAINDLGNRKIIDTDKINPSKKWVYLMTYKLLSNA